MNLMFMENRYRYLFPISSTSLSEDLQAGNTFYTPYIHLFLMPKWLLCNNSFMMRKSLFDVHLYTPLDCLVPL
jgi:hypothetical protein